MVSAPPLGRGQGTSRIGSVLLAATGLFVGLCLLTYHPTDTALLSSHPHHPPHNLGGAIGTWIGLLGRGGFGWASLVLPVWAVLWAWRLWQGHRAERHLVSLTVALLCLMAGLGTLLALRDVEATTRMDLGGVVGLLLARAGTYYLGTFGTVLTAGCVGLLAWLVISGQTLRLTGRRGLGRLLTAISSRLRPLSGTLWRGLQGLWRTPAVTVGPEELAEPILEPPPPEPLTPRASEAPRGRVRSVRGPKREPALSPPRPPSVSGFRLPSLDALATPPPMAERQITEDLQTNAKVVEETLREFGVEASVVNIDRGPTVTRFELKPAPGVKLTRIASLADEVALVLKAASCHIVAPIPGKGLVGVEVPNSTTAIVYLKEILTAREFQSSTSPLTLPLGKDVAGRPIVADLREFPHLLIAGATGSGKTVCLNSLLVGLLSHTTPEQVRLLMVDPKMVELAVFNGIPHLIAPVVTDTKKASAALAWAVQEMERRYQLFAHAGVRNLQGYNEHCSRLKAEGSRQEQDLKPLPYLVIVIDELADLMMAASQDVEVAITRLAQLSRAVGLHIILATQRPSVDVVTGVIKANFPARIAFQVASKVDSRTILDMNGADKLLGRGDLLFLRPGAAKPIRAQGAFVTDPEIERITRFLKDQGAPVYDERLLEAQRQPVAAGPWSTEKDELYELAKQVVLETGQASTSLLQRRLRLGYGRAARMLDLMEQEGLIGPPQGSRPREVLASRG